MRTLSKQQIIFLHEHMIQETGGAHGLRDEGMLDSALAAPLGLNDNENTIAEIISFPASIIERSLTKGVQ